MDAMQVWSQVFTNAVSRIVHTSVEEGIQAVNNTNCIDTLEAALQRESSSSNPRKSLIGAIERRLRKLAKVKRENKNEAALLLRLLRQVERFGRWDAPARTDLHNEPAQTVQDLLHAQG